MIKLKKEIIFILKSHEKFPNKLLMISNVLIILKKYQSLFIGLLKIDLIVKLSFLSH
jgi:hypothetical protein